MGQLGFYSSSSTRGGEKLLRTEISGRYSCAYFGVTRCYLALVPRGLTNFLKNIFDEFYGEFF